MTTSTTTTSSAVVTIAAELASAAQAVYDAWEQDDEGVDDIYGAGGICDDVASSMASIMAERFGVDTATQYVEADFHTVVIAAFSDGVFMVDVPARTYERGTGYVWTKIPDVLIGPEDVVATRLSADPSDMWRFVEGMDEPANAPSP